MTTHDASRREEHALTLPPEVRIPVLIDQLRRQCAELHLSHCLLLTGPAVLRAFTSEALDALKRIGGAVADVPLRPDRVAPDYWPSVIELDLDHAVPADLCEAAVTMALNDWEPGLLKLGQGHRIGAFLFSDAPLDKIARHLVNIAVQQRSDRPGQRLLGIADPAAFEGLWRVCTEAQREHLLGPIKLWRTLGRWGQWTDYRRSAVSGDEAAKGRFLGLDDHQWQALFDVRPINRAWARMRGEGRVVRREDFEQLPDSLRRAHRYGLTDPQDLELYALHALEMRADFDLHPRMQTLLSQRPADMFYSRAVADLSEADWADIRTAHEEALTR